MLRKQISNYTNFIRSHWHLLSFGFLMVFFSSFGQTFFVGVFTPSIESHFDLSHSEWGSIFMAGTILSALILPLTGSVLDHVPLKLYAIFVSCLLAVACVCAGLSTNVFLLVLSVFLLRQAGQGLATHTAVTAILKGFGKDRGKAVAITGLGFPLGRGILPIAAIFLITSLGWQITYILCGILVLLCMLPATLFLLGEKPNEKKNAHYEVHDSNHPPREKPSSTVKGALSTPLFYLLIPGILVPSFLDTALAFHVLLIADLKHWPVTLVLSGYAFYAVMSLISSVCAGPILDRFGSRELLKYSLAPAIMGLFILMYCDSPVWAFIYLGLFGAVSGLRMTLIPFALSEIYGTRYIASIRSFVASLSIFASALGPPVLGIFLDLQFTITKIGWIYILYLIPAIALTLVATRLYKKSFRKIQGRQKF